VLDTKAKLGDLNSTTVIDESLDIMLWALTQKDPEGWLSNTQDLDDALALIERMDNDYKPWLDRYKYFDRFPEQPQSAYRQAFEEFLLELERRLSKGGYLSGSDFGFLDAATAPFIRQFAHVDLVWFEGSCYPNTIQWLAEFKASLLFREIMKKFPVWTPESNELIIGAPTSGESLNKTSD
jgi:glutathione S-transferase